MPLNDRMKFVVFQLRLRFEPVAPQNIENVAIKEVMKGRPTSASHSLLSMLVLKWQQALRFGLATTLLPPHRSGNGPPLPPINLPNPAPSRCPLMAPSGSSPSRPGLVLTQGLPASA